MILSILFLFFQSQFEWLLFLLDCLRGLVRSDLSCSCSGSLHLNYISTLEIWTSSNWKEFEEFSVQIKYCCILNLLYDSFGPLRDRYYYINYCITLWNCLKAMTLNNSFFPLPPWESCFTGQHLCTLFCFHQSLLISTHDTYLHTYFTPWSLKA